MGKIDQRRETDIDYIPEDSIFLLEMDYDNLMKSSIHNKTYWVVATEAAIKVGQRKANSDVRSRTQLKRRQQRSTRERFRIIDVEKEMTSDRRTCTVFKRGGARGSSHRNAVINTPSKRKSLCSTSTVEPRQIEPTDNRTLRITVSGFSGIASGESNEKKNEERDQNEVPSVLQEVTSVVTNSVQGTAKGLNPILYSLERGLAPLPY